MRTLLLAVVLLCGVALAADDEEDDRALDVRPLGPSIGERVERLEREWEADVKGTPKPPDADDGSAAHDPLPRSSGAGGVTPAPPAPDGPAPPRAPGTDGAE